MTDKNHNKLRRRQQTADWSVACMIAFVLVFIIISALDAALRNSMAQLSAETIRLIEPAAGTYGPRERAPLGIKTGTIAEWTPYQQNGENHEK